MSDERKAADGQAPGRRLGSWKEIAAYLAKDLRTAQRWQDDGLPIYREGKNVFAWTEELDRWRKGRIVGPAYEPSANAAKNPEISPTHLKVRRLAPWLAVASVVTVVGMGLTAVVWSSRRSHDVAAAMAPPMGRLFVNATSEGRNPTRIELNEVPELLCVTPDGLKIYAASTHSRVLSIVHPKDGIVSTMTLPWYFNAFVMSSDGNRLYVGSQGGVSVINTATDQLMPNAIATPGPVHDLVVTADGKKLFMAMNRQGVWRALTKNGELKQLTDQICPVRLGMDNQGRRLYVPYQCGGPNGRSGHDALELFDTETEKSLGIVSGPPFVGGTASVSPDARLAVLDGLSACEGLAYDHEGCPFVPSRVFHFLDPSDRRLVKTIGMPMGTGPARFLDSKRILFVGGALVAMDASRYAVAEKWEQKPQIFTTIAALPDLHHVYVGLQEPKAILVLDAESPDCSPPAGGLALSYTADGTADDLIGGTALTHKGGMRFGPGRVGQAFILDGQSDYLVAPWTGLYHFGLLDSSVVAYVKFASIEGEMTILDQTQSERTFSARLTKARDHRFRFEFATSLEGPSRLFSTTSVVADRWYLVCVTKNDDELELYLDGHLEDHIARTAQSAVSLKDDPIPYLGATKDQRQFFHGKLDEILFYDRALGPQEVRRLYEMRESGPCRI